MSRPNAAFVRALPAELEGWVARGLIDERQGAAILAEYPAPSPRAWWVVVLATVGALFMGVGVITLVGANWQALGDLAKLALLVAAMLGSYALAYRLRFVRHHARLGNALFLLGSLLYGALVFFVAQGLQLRADLALLPLLWAAGVAPMAYALRLPGLLHVAIFAVLAAFVTQLFADGHGSVPQLLALFAVAGLAALALGERHAAHARWRNMSGPYRVWGAPLVLLATYLASFSYPWVMTDAAGKGLAPLAALMTLLASGAVALVWRAARDSQGRLLALGLSVPLGVNLLVLWAPRTLSANDGYPPGAALMNALLLALSLALLYLGERQGRRGWINLGVLGVGALVFTRYLDVFGRLLDTGLLFFSTGALLFILGWLLERGRRTLVRRAGRA